MIKHIANAMTIPTNEKHVEFEVQLTLSGLDIFKELIKQEHYLFNPMMMQIRKNIIASTGVEPVDNAQPVSVEKLKGMVHRISYKKFRTPVETADLELFYIPDRNVFMLKLLSSVSDEFDYIIELKKNKGAL